jgi:sulfide:quinone oxidoreductase
MTSTSPHVVIAGGGVAALEALIAMHHLAPGRQRVTVLAPQAEFVYRPMSVAEPFCLGHADRHPLAAITREFGATFVRDSLGEIDAQAHTVTTGAGESIGYDSLLLAIGARPEPAYRHAITFGAEGAPEALTGLLSDLELGYAKRVAFVVPSTVTWSLPLYELAVMTARDARNAGMEDLELYFITPELRALEAFGPEASAMLEGILADEGIELITATFADVGHGFVLAGDRRLDVDRVLALPVPFGPAITGVPADPEGFIPVDDHGRVVGIADVWAAGDATDFPIKQGGLAAQQAVAATESMLAAQGADLDPQPFRPVLRGMLLTGGQRRWMRAPVGATPGHAATALRTLWWPPTKIASRYLAPYLMSREDAALLAVAPEGAKPIERDLELLGTAGRRP